MDTIDVTINKALEENCEYVQKLIEQVKRKLSKKQKELAAFFNIPPESLSDLRSSKQTLVRIEFRNAMFCFEKFIQESGKVIEEANYDYYNGERMPPVRIPLECEQNVFTRIMEDAVVFFEWGGAKYCMDVCLTRYSSEGEHDFSLTAKDQNTLDWLLEAFKAYCQKNHYLKGKKFDGVSGGILPLNGHHWDDLVWPDGMKERLQSEIEVVLRNAALFNYYGLNNKKGFILAGEPGNGKTLLLKILAKETDATCILVPFDEFKTTPYLFSLARDLAPTVLILEDIDLFGTDRDDTASNVELGKLMNQLDGMVENREIIVIATTNRLEKVEKALQNRPGRFDRIYVIPNPDFGMRIKLISHFIGRIPNEVLPEHIETLAEEFSGYSAAYLKELVNSGFAQAILRDSQTPILRFCDLQSMVEILKGKKDKVPVGFAVQVPVKEQSQILSQNNNPGPQRSGTDAAGV